jgi:hypothetical protein
LGDGMANLSRLETYLALERQMLQLDAAGDALADAVREAMDPLWYELGPEERAFLDGRTVPTRLEELEPLHGSLIRVEAPEAEVPLVDRAPFEVQGWGMAA